MLDKIPVSPTLTCTDKALINQVHALTVGQAELIKRMVRIETRLCLVLDRLSIEIKHHKEPQ